MANPSCPDCGTTMEACEEWRNGTKATYHQDSITHGNTTTFMLAEHFKCPNCDKRHTKLTTKDKTGCCYIATCVYGSYDCAEVWTLRRYRDDTLDKSWLGRIFIRSYYATAPKVIKLFGKTKWFNKLCKSVLDRWVVKLQRNGIESNPYIDKLWR